MNYIFLILWLIFPITWIFILKSGGVKITQISIFIIVLYGIIFTQYIGLPILYFDLDDFRKYDVTNKKILFNVFLFTSLTIYLLLVGYIVAKKLFNVKHFYESNLQFTRMNDNQIKRLLFLTLICLIVFFAYLSKIGKDNIALFSALGIVNSNSSEFLRSAMGNSFDGKYHWYYLFMNRILLFCVYTFFGLKMLQPSLSKSFYFYSILFIVIFSLTVATEKGPLSYFFISLFILYSIIKRNGYMPIKNLVFLMILLILMLTWFYMSFMHIEDLGSAFFSIFSRFFTGQIQPAYHYLEYFPNVHGYLLGRSMTNPMGIFPFESFNIALEVMAWYDSGQEFSGIVGSMPTVFWGELYANFGVFGIIFFSPFIGFCIHLIEIIFLRMQKNALSLGLYVWFIMYLYNLNGTGITSYILDIYPIFVLLSFFFVKGLNFSTK